MSETPLAEEQFKPIYILFAAPLLFVAYLGTSYGYHLVAYHFGWSNRPYGIGDKAVAAASYTLSWSAVLYWQMRKKEKKERSNVMSIRSGKEL
jgi:hypothetical protein